MVQLDPTRAEKQERIDGLRRQHVVDHVTVTKLRAKGVADDEAIAGLEQQHVVDQELIADLQTQGLLDQEKIANLETALVTARRIGAALGVLMEREKLTDVQAFDRLRAASQHRHMKLRDVADWLVQTGELPS